MKTEIELYPEQFDFVVSDTRFTAFIGGIGSGKTLGGCVKAMAHCQPGALGLIVAPTYGMLRDATLRTFKDVAGKALLEFRRGEMRAKMINGSEILFRSADDPERLRGPNLSWAFIDEAALCHKMAWPIIIGRLRKDGIAGPCWLTTTPKGRNWVWEEFAHVRRDNYEMFHSRTADNPYLASEFVESLEVAYSGDFALQELAGEFVAFEGLIYDFDPDVHIQRRGSNEMHYWALAADEGFTNPAVILLIGVDADSRLHIAREYYERGKLQETVVKAAVEMARSVSPMAAVVVDSSAAGLIADLMNNGLPARAAKGRVLDGIGAIQGLLKVQLDGRPRLTVDPSCVNTIAEFESYVWREGRDAPVKQSDHAMDAARYFVTWVMGATQQVDQVVYNPVRIR